MLTIHVAGQELFDETTYEFVTTKAYTIQMEHSLVSVSKWESKFKKPFLHSKDKSVEELQYYFRCMTITQNIPDEAYAHFSSENIKEINDYIADSYTATTFGDVKSDKPTQERKRIVTAEVIYAWMIGFRIDRSYEKWHLNKLMTLIRVCNEQQNPPKKQQMSAAERRSLNASRKKPTRR